MVTTWQGYYGIHYNVLLLFSAYLGEHFLVSLQVLQHLNVFDEGDLDAAAEALDDVIFFLEFLLVAVQSEP